MAPRASCSLDANVHPLDRHLHAALGASCSMDANVHPLDRHPSPARGEPRPVDADVLPSVTCHRAPVSRPPSHGSRPASAAPSSPSGALGPLHDGCGLAWTAPTSLTIARGCP